MRRSTVMLALAAWALAGLAWAQSDFSIGLGETRTGTIPTEQIDHRYVLTLPPGVPRVTIAVNAGGADADLAVHFESTGEELFLDTSSDPSPAFTIEAPRAGRYEIVVMNLLWQPLQYTLRVSTDAAAPVPGDEYYVAEGGAAVGPMGLDALVERIARGATAADDLVWRPGLETWVRADAVPELAPRFVTRAVPPPLPPTMAAPPPAPAADAPAATAKSPPSTGPSVPAAADAAGPVAPAPAPGWQPARAGDACLWAPPGWHDLRAQVEGFLSEPGVAVLAVWSAVPNLDVMEALLIVYRLNEARLREILDETAGDAIPGSLVERAGDVAGRPGTWRTLEFADQGRMWTGYPAAPDADGAYLVVVGNEGPTRKGQHEATLLAAFDAVGSCAGSGDAVGATPLPAVAEPPATRANVTCGETARDVALRGLPVDTRVLVTCPAGCTGTQAVWGTDLYTDDSSICRAAVHAGLLDVARGGSVVLTIRPGATSYQASERHGVTSRSYGSWSRSFSLASFTGSVGGPGAPGSPAEYVAGNRVTGR